MQLPQGLVLCLNDIFKDTKADIVAVEDLALLVRYSIPLRESDTLQFVASLSNLSTVKSYFDKRGVHYTVGNSSLTFLCRNFVIKIVFVKQDLFNWIRLSADLIDGVSIASPEAILFFHLLFDVNDILVLKVCIENGILDSVMKDEADNTGFRYIYDKYRFFKSFIKKGAYVTLDGGYKHKSKTQRRFH